MSRALQRFSDLGSTVSELHSSQVPVWTNRVMEELETERNAMSAEQWLAYTASIRYDVAALKLREDPFTNRCFVKPRGYAGDAVALDFIYGHQSTIPALARATQFGREVHRAAIASGPCRAVRARKEILTREIDRLSSARSQPRILSLACGHLREVFSSTAIATGSIGEVVAIDQDSESIEEVYREARSFALQPIVASAKAVASALVPNLGTFDFIYCSGLYDYLSDTFARHLTKALVELLKPDGKLWIANFAPGLVGRAYMEAIMDWWLTYREEEELLSLVPASGHSSGRPLSVSTFRTEDRGIVFLEINRHQARD